MHISLTERGKWLTVGLNGRFDAEGAGTVSEALEKAISHGRRFLELDMTGVDYLSSAGIRVLLLHYQKIGRLKGVFSLTGMQDRVTRILEIAGLYDLLLPAGSSTINADHTPAAIMNLSGWTLQAFELDRAGILIPRFAGVPCTGIVPAKCDLPCEVVPFPPSTLSIGIGALGYDDAQCRDRFGFYMTAGGIAAYKPAAPNHAADYVVYAEEYVPTMHAVSGLSMSGNFSHLISFECEEGRTIEFSDLACCMLRIQGKPAAGFVLVAECANGVFLACGIAGTKESNEMKGWLRSPGDGGSLSCHIHVALFPYQPLRLGFVKLKETVAGLFERELLDVVHVQLPVEPASPQSFRLLRGVAWFSGIMDY